MTSLKNRAKHQLFATKRKVHLGKLSVGDGVLIALTAIKASPDDLHHRTVKTGHSQSTSPPRSDFAKLMRGVIQSRRGSIYAAFVTAVDHQETFNADHFAIAMKRLGIFDDIRARIEGTGYAAFGKTISTYGPWYWGDLVSRELRNVKKEVSSPVSKALGMFREELSDADVDQMLESTALGVPPTSGIASLVLGAAELDMDRSVKLQHTELLRRLITQGRLELLDKSSSLEATFETFYQHLLTDPSALRRLLPRVKFKGVAFSSSELHTLFRNSEVKRSFLRAFKTAYDRAHHAIRMGSLSRILDQMGVNRQIAAAASRINKPLDTSGAAAVSTSVIGLFYAFVGDTKGRQLPMMRSISAR